MSTQPLKMATVFEIVQNLLLNPEWLFTLGPIVECS